MAWSTRELAELAGTTVNAIRHYHRIALLAEPTRRYNGYKQYGASHLIRLLRIRRLSELGVPLTQIREICEDGAAAPDVLRQVDAGLAAEIERLTRARTDIANILHTRTPIESSTPQVAPRSEGAVNRGRGRPRPPARAALAGAR